MSITSESIPSLAQHYLTGNYGQRDLTLVRGKGVYVWDPEGNRYIDLLSGIGVANLGHCHPKVVEAVKTQVETLIHVSNLYLIEPQIELAGLLIDNGPMDKAFFCNSGTEANEAALKLARRYAYDHYGPERHTLIALDNSFHGRTMGAISLTGQPKYHEGFQPLVPGVKHAPINDIEAMRSRFDESVCAVVVEPIQGEGGIHICRTEYLKSLRELCDSTGALLIFDEVQCGLGRAGHLFASDEFGVEPDMICLAKSLGGGVPIGAMLAKEHVAKSLAPGTHAATFGGNPLACAAACAAIKVILENQLAEKSKELGAKFKQRLEELQSKYNSIVEVRGMGLMIGVQMDEPAAPLIQQLRARGYIAGSAGPDVLRFLPPLIIEEDTLMPVVDVLDDLLSS